MSRPTDLEQHIKAAYDLVRQYETILHTSSDPKEQARARREIKEQWALIDGYVAELRALTGEPLPAEIGAIAARLGAEASRPAAWLDSPEVAGARRNYLAALRRQYGLIQPHAFTALAQDERVGHVRQFPLLGSGGVYVPLSFDLPTARLDEVAGAPDPAEARRLAKLADRDPAPRGLTDVLKLPGHLAIIGDAGGGKTTLLHVLAVALAAEESSLLPPELAAALPNPRPLPVFLPLRLFEHACRQEKYARTGADLLAFVDDWFAAWSPGVTLPAGFLAAHVRAGRAWLLLDALDEVADPNHRKTVRNIIQQLAGDFAHSRFIVTARVAGYRGARLADRFSLVHVRDLDDEQRSRMINGIYQGLDLPRAESQAADLADRFRRSETLADLGRTPVMVWTAAVIHALRGTLPDSRAALYNAYVDILLKHSFKESDFDTVTVEELSGGQGWALTDRRLYLNYAAFQVHTLLENQPERQGEPQLVIGEDELADNILARYFLKQELAGKPQQAVNLAREFLSLMVNHSGLLYETPEGYTIGDHLTMQEFLAGCYLAEQYAWDDAAGYEAFFRDKVTSSWWREVFSLAAGYLAEQPSFAARGFIQKIAKSQTAPADQLAGLALAARCLLPLRRRRQRPSWYNSEAASLSGRLYQLLYATSGDASPDAPAEAPVALRQEAGLALGLLHGDPAEAGQPDPRFAHPAGLPDFVKLEAGWFMMGSSDAEVEQLEQQTGEDYFKRELPRHRVYLDAFELAKYPTTNAMFARFIEAGGYADERWWVEAVADNYWSKDEGYHYGNEPGWWDDPRLNNPAQPVVGISWYEATAYCRWLSTTLADGYTYRLPTEAEWERAARGGDDRRYPWGNEWQASHCNNQESGLEATSPVGLFPQGAAPGGLQDLGGQVWEWCRDWYGEDYYSRSAEARNPAGPDRGEHRVLRGGSWYDDSTLCRCGCRNGGGGGIRGNYFGFRCARSLSS